MTQFNSNPHHSLVLTVLQHVSLDRLQKAVTALAATDLSVTLTRQTETELRALVKNGEEKEYGVTLTAEKTFCSCPDALYRGVTCKHVTAVALSVLRLPQGQEEEPQIEEQKPVNLKLTKVRPGFAFSA